MCGLPVRQNETFLLILLTVVCRINEQNTFNKGHRTVTLLTYLTKKINKF